MTIEQQALALVNEVRAEGNLTPVDDINYGIWAGIALHRSLERHEAFRQEVSEAVKGFFDDSGFDRTGKLSRFIIEKPDPLVDVFKSMGFAEHAARENASLFKKKLDAHGLQITGVET